MTTQTQHRPDTRAAHGSPEFTATIAAKVTPDQKRLFQRSGGSGWLRRLIDRERKYGRLVMEAQSVLDALAEGNAALPVYASRLQTAIRKVQQ